MNYLGKLLTEQEKAQEVFVYQRTFLWDATYQRWVVQNTQSDWLPYMVALACSEVGSYDPSGCKVPPYFVGEKWIWRDNKWELSQRESNWPQGPHTCFGC